MCHSPPAPIGMSAPRADALQSGQSGAMTATVQYARNGDVHLAYQVIGDGSHDVLFLTGGTMPMDALDQHPKGLEVLFGLRRLGRLILMDQRGVGQSDRTDM